MVLAALLLRSVGDGRAQRDLTGIDLGWKWDTTAIVPLWEAPEEKWRYGRPCILTPPRDGTSLSVAAVFDAIEGFGERFRVDRVVLDPSADGEHLAQRIEAELAVPVTAHSQKVGPMCEAAGRFASLLRQGKLEHPADPEFNSHVLAAVAKVMPDGSWRFVKDRKPIDALIAAAMVLNVEIGEGLSVYETRGILVV
jgi:hypothetical protein